MNVFHVSRNATHSVERAVPHWQKGTNDRSVPSIVSFCDRGKWQECSLHLFFLFWKVSNIWIVTQDTPRQGATYVARHYCQPTIYYPKISLLKQGKIWTRSSTTVTNLWNWKNHRTRIGLKARMRTKSRSMKPHGVSNDWNDLVTLSGYMYTYVLTCAVHKQETHANWCECILTYSDICWCMLTYANKKPMPIDRQHRFFGLISVPVWVQ